MPDKHTTLAQALLAAQADMPALQKDAINPHFRNKYVTLQKVIQAVVPVLNAHGLILTQWPTVVDGENALKTRLQHAGSGETLEDTMLLMLDKASPQAQGSAITYARRYSLTAILGLAADEDDDGNATKPQPARARAARENGATQENQPPVEGEVRAPVTPGEAVVHFGKNNGKRLGELTEFQVKWYAEDWEPTFSDPRDQILKDAAVKVWEEASVPF